MYQLEVLNPVAQQRGDLQQLAVSPRPATLEGKTVGLMWNGFPQRRHRSATNKRAVERAVPVCPDEFLRGRSSRAIRGTETGG